MNKIAIRICSPQKSGKWGYLREIYTNKMLQSFFNRCMDNNITYAILSRKYGICREQATWDSYPDSEMLDDEELLDKLKSSCKYFPETELVYWNHRPITHDKWVKMLRDAGFNVLEVRTLDELVNKFKQKKLF